MCPSLFLCHVIMLSRVDSIVFVDYMIIHMLGLVLFWHMKGHIAWRQGVCTSLMPCMDKWLECVDLTVPWCDFM